MRAPTPCISLTLLLATACHYELSGPPDDLDGRAPYRDQWRLALDAPMPLEGAAGVRTLRVGGEAYDDNFANRGDILVEFHDEDRILVELRRFTHAVSEEDAQDDYVDIQLWAYRGGEAPLRPRDMIFPRPCVAEDGELINECGLRVFYDGLSQLARAGADMRITLPARYQGLLELTTEDSIADSSYTNRGSICVEPTRATVSAQLHRGEFYGSIATSEVAPSAVPSLYAHGDAADLHFDVPASLRTELRVGYEDDAEKQERCWAELELQGWETTLAAFGDTRSTIEGTAGPEAVPEAIDARATGRAETCDVVGFTESPEDWLADADAQPAEVRGVLSMCNDCLRAIPCEELLGG